MEQPRAYDLESRQILECEWIVGVNWSGRGSKCGVVCLQVRIAEERMNV